MGIWEIAEISTVDSQEEHNWEGEYDQFVYCRALHRELDNPLDDTEFFEGRDYARFNNGANNLSDDDAETFLSHLEQHSGLTEEAADRIHLELQFLQGPEENSNDSSERQLIDDEILTETAPYYWVNQSNNPEEIEDGYLQAPRTDFQNYDLQKLEIGDIVFNYHDAAIIGYSEVTTPAYLVTEDGEEHRQVDVEVTEFDEPIPFAEVFAYLIREDVRLERYYPINEAGINQQYLFNLSEKAGEHLLAQGSRTDSSENQEGSTFSDSTLPSQNTTLSLSELFERVLSTYPVEQIGEGLTAHEARTDIEQRIPEAIRELLPNHKIEIKSSAGKGRWTSIPWVAVMDPRETTRIQEGTYVVYLFEPQEDRVTLTLNQGVTALKNDVGIKEARQQLTSTAEKVRKEIDSEGFAAGPLQFPYASQRNKLYGPGTILYQQYSLENLPSDEVLRDDLHNLVREYQEYIQATTKQTPLINAGNNRSDVGRIAERTNHDPSTSPTVYQVPVKTGQNPIRTNFQRTVLNDVPREPLEEITEIPIDQEELRVWGNREDTPADIGDYLLFADRDGRRSGQYTILSRVAHATILEPEAAMAFTDAIGWGEAIDATFHHILFLDPVYEADLDRETFWETLGFKGWPNDTYSAINFDRSGSNFDSEYQSIPEFLEQIKGDQLYPKPAPAAEDNPVTQNTEPTTDAVPENPDHPLLKRTLEDDTTVYKFTAPPDYWLTVFEYTALSFQPADKDRWEQPDPGDVILFHSRQDPSWEDLSPRESALIGAGIIQDRTTKPNNKNWWYDEHEGGPKGNSFPYLLTFSRLFATGDLEKTDTTKQITDKDPETVDAELEALLTNSLPFERADTICRQISDTGFPRHRLLESLPTDKGIALLNALTTTLEEVPAIALDKNLTTPINSNKILEDLHFQDNIANQILEQISTALRSNKHILLTGPPGTGKTEIAERVCDYLTDTHPYLYTDFEMTTATADWSTFDTVGGYMPNESSDNDQNLSFTPGIVLNRLKDRQNETQANDLLVVDELNRADIDKAFGQLFTLLSGQSVQLPYTVNDHEIELTTHADLEGTAQPHQYVVPNSWRIFATMNAYDKTSLYEMSYAFMRRFAFIRVPAPDLEATTETDNPAAELIHEYADVWGLEITQQEAQAVGRVWQKTNTAVDERAIGPAIIKDVLQYVTLHTDDLEYHLTQAVISYIFPQLEGVPKRKTIVRELTNVPDIKPELLKDAAQEMLQVPLTANE
ncbi:DUF3578 domain-containing protein [Natronococcus sp. A-GB1]|uniref:MrcB family domain-containing protein n=1 Tax=Natronococcus sp. A-GB1 TaxID=3037648 RepID=UPI00241FF646|nr:DUF3578 domain-containing protein [Natronococcus sp. A-GB1]MDG5762085.1 DUF3578 domain-containing protein [Natronococcus sp. A-GB1]